MAEAVVITGLGCLGAFGTGFAALARTLAAGKALATDIDRSAGYHRKNSSQKVAQCRTDAGVALDITPWLTDDDGRRMSDLSQYAVTCARMALQHAGLAELPAERTSVTIATAFGPGGFTERLALQVLQRGGKFASPFLFTDCVANAAAGQIAIAVGARGANITICQREAGPLLALGQAAHDVSLGRADVCLVGAIDELKPLSHAILDRFRAVARPLAHDGGIAAELPRPFDLRRNGYLAGEGGAVLVLEREDHARARRATILARVGTGVRAFDPTASRVGHGTGSATFAESMRLGFGGQLDSVDTVVSAASGARRGDALEAELLRLVLPNVARVLTPKAVTGEFGGGTLAAAMLAMSGADFALPEGCANPDPTIDIPMHAGPVRSKRMLCSAHGAGGVSCWIMLEQP